MNIYMGMAAYSSEFRAVGNCRYSVIQLFLRLGGGGDGKRSLKLSGSWPWFRSAGSKQEQINVAPSVDGDDDDVAENRPTSCEDFDVNV